jgi:hypothetical protein
MSATIYVIDTSYLLELFGCGRDSNKMASDEVRKRFKLANAAGGRFYVPLPCLFELGDHIADVKHGELREKLVNQLVSTVQTSLESSKPWTITPTGSPETVLPKLLERFAPAAIKQNIGLVDVFTWDEAARLKAKLAEVKARVHIWTNDRNLKGKEPDTETNPYLWG